MSGCRASSEEIAKCVANAKRFGGVWCVVSIDDGFGFVNRVVRECETIGDEFEAFDGRVLFSSDDM